MRKYKVVNLKRLIRNWHTKAGGEDYFSKFVFEYLAFIAYLKSNKYPDANTDRYAIQQLKRNSQLTKDYVSLVQNNRELKRNWERVKKEFDRKPFQDAARARIGREEHAWWNCPHNDPQEKTSEERGKASGVIHSLEDWGNMVEFWYSVRNNLFHGAKDPEHKRDQFAVKYAYKTLRELVELLLSYSGGVR